MATDEIKEMPKSWAMVGGDGLIFITLKDVT
jgi:hypothetical protein